MHFVCELQLCKTERLANLNASVLHGELCDFEYQCLQRTEDNTSSWPSVM